MICNLEATCTALATTSIAVLVVNLAGRVVRVPYSHVFDLLFDKVKILRNIHNSAFDILII